jgi:hypothetical protein
MADKKITELSLIDSPIVTDIIPIVDDPGGTPVTTKATLTQVGDLFKDRTETLTNKTLTSPVINTPTGDVATITGAQTLTNKTLTAPLITSTTSGIGVLNCYGNLSIGTGATATLTFGSAYFYGFVYICDKSTGMLGIICFYFGGPAVVYQSGTEFVLNSSPSTSQTGIYATTVNAEADTLTIKNGYAAGHTYSVSFTRLQ